MTTKTKIIVAIVGIVAVSSFYAYNKFLKLQAIFEKIDIKISSIRNIKLSLKEIRFTTDIKMINPTQEDFNINGYVATLKRFNVFYLSKYVATTKLSLTALEIPRQNELVIKNIEVIVPTSSIFKNIQDFLSFSQDNVSVEAVIEVAGREIYIKP